MSSKQAAAAGKKRPAPSKGEGKGGAKVPKGSSGGLQPSAVAEWLLSADATAFKGCFGKAASGKYQQLKDNLQLLASSVDGAIAGMAGGELRDYVRAQAPFKADDKHDYSDNMCGRRVSGKLLIGPKKVALSASSSVYDYEGDRNVVTDCDIFSFEEEYVDDSGVAHDDITFHWDVAAELLRKSGSTSFCCLDLEIYEPLVVPAVIDTKSPPSVLKAFVWGLMNIIEDEMNEADPGDTHDLGLGWSAETCTTFFMEKDTEFCDEMFPEGK